MVKNVLLFYYLIDVKTSECLQVLLFGKVFTRKITFFVKNDSYEFLLGYKDFFAGRVC